MSCLEAHQRSAKAGSKQLIDHFAPQLDHRHFGRSIARRVAKFYETVFRLGRASIIDDDHRRGVMLGGIGRLGTERRHGKARSRRRRGGICFRSGASSSLGG